MENKRFSGESIKTPVHLIVVFLQECFLVVPNYKQNLMEAV